MTVYGNVLKFDCNENMEDLTGLDVSHNDLMSSLECTNNSLTSLDVSKNEKLISLQCADNFLTTLDVSSCTNLKTLNCFNNNLTTLDVSKNTQLRIIYCFSNKLTSLDVSQQVSEENYYLKSSAYTDKVRDAIESGRMKIVPEVRKKEFLELMKDGLHDVSISRPRKSLSWGVPVPDDEDQVMYVWLDALANYITVLGYPDREGWEEFWPADVQVIGKDILRFHAGIWPVMLLGLGLPLPKTLLVHGFVNVGGAKMSKTVGNVVDPMEIIRDYGVDAFRYYFSRHIPTQDDGDFTWEKFEKAYNGELGNDLGNLVQRVAAMIGRYQAGVVGEIPPAESTTWSRTGRR